MLNNKERERYAHKNISQKSRYIGSPPSLARKLIQLELKQNPNIQFTQLYNRIHRFCKKRTPRELRDIFKEEKKRQMKNSSFICKSPPRTASAVVGQIDWKDQRLFELRMVREIQHGNNELEHPGFRRKPLDADCVFFTYETIKPENQIRVTKSVFREAQKDNLINLIENFDSYWYFLTEVKRLYNKVIDYKEQQGAQAKTSLGIGRHFELIDESAYDTIINMLNLQDVFKLSTNDLSNFKKYARATGRGFDSSLMLTDGHRLIDNELKCILSPHWKNIFYLTCSWIVTHILPRFNEQSVNRTVVFYSPYKIKISKKAEYLLKRHRIKLVILHNLKDIYNHILKTLKKQLTKLGTKIHKLKNQTTNKQNRPIKQNKPILTCPSVENFCREARSAQKLENPQKTWGGRGVSSLRLAFRLYLFQESINCFQVFINRR